MNLPSKGVLYACTPKDGVTYVRVGEISDVDAITDMSDFYETQVGEVFFDSLNEGTTISISVKMNRAEVIRFAMATLDVSNNRIRYHGGKALRLRQIRKWDK